MRRDGSRKDYRPWLFRLSLIAVLQVSMRPAATASMQWPRPLLHVAQCCVLSVQPARCLHHCAERLRDAILATHRQLFE